MGKMATLAPQYHATRRDLGRGLYSLADLRAYLGVSGASQDAKHALPWLRVLNPVFHRSRHADYSFSDLISLFVVRELLRKGVRPRAIRDAESYLRELWQTDRPFVSDRIQTDGRNVFPGREPVPGQLEAADLRGQQMMREMVKDRLTDVHYSDGAAAYWTPLDHVRLDPRVQFGEPVIVGTRVPTEVIAGVARHAGPEEAASRFDVSLPAATSAIQFEDRLASVLS